MGRRSKVVHPYVAAVSGVCGGEPVIRGTRFPVRSIVVYVLRQGMTADEVVREWPHLKPAQVYDALSYYHDHKAEIDALIRRHEKGQAGRRIAI